MAQTGLVAWDKSTPSNNGSADSAVNFAEGMAPSAVNNSARGLMASAAKYRDDTSGQLTTGGTTTAYTLTTNQVFSSLSVLNGQELTVRFDQANGATPTLNVDSLGAKALNINASTAVPEGFIAAGSVWRLTYDNSIPAFILNGVAAAISGTSLALSGDATIGGDLSVVGDFAINTNKFTVAASSGNTAIAGTLAVTGASQFTGQATFTAVPVMPMVIAYQRLAATPYTATDTLGASYVIPNDGSTPLVTEGFEILTKAITPLSNGHIVRVKVSGFAFATGTGSNVTVALFRDSTFINGLAVGSNSVAANFGFEFDDEPSTTSEVTYSVRVGSNAASSTFAVNKSSIGAISGSKSTMVLEELGPTPS